jgi:hypothetical protein
MHFFVCGQTVNSATRLHVALLVSVKHAVSEGWRDIHSVLLPDIVRRIRWAVHVEGWES